MSVWTIVQTIITYAWLFAILLLLWRLNFGGNDHHRQVADLLRETSQQNLEMARISAESAAKAVEAARILADFLGKSPDAAL